MILGSFSIDTVVSSVTERIRKMTEQEGLTFHPVANGGFSGGYYLHRRLPYSSADFYYSDELNDIMVLMSGSIHNRSELLVPAIKKHRSPILNLLLISSGMKVRALSEISTVILPFSCRNRVKSRHISSAIRWAFARWAGHILGRHFSFLQISSGCAGLFLTARALTANISWGILSLLITGKHPTER